MSRASRNKSHPFETIPPEVKTCLNKIQFNTDKAARSIAEWKGNLYVYQCGVCELYHLTSKPPYRDKKLTHRMALDKK